MAQTPHAMTAAPPVARLRRALLALRPTVAAPDAPARRGGLPGADAAADLCRVASLTLIPYARSPNADESGYWPAITAPLPSVVARSPGPETLRLTQRSRRRPSRCRRRVRWR